MSSYPADKIKKSLLKKGFRKVNNDHVFFTFYFNDKKTAISTKISHSHSEIGPDLLSRMAKQLGLNRHEISLLIECPLKKSDYENLLIQSGHIYI